MTTDSFSQSTPAKAAISLESTGMAAKLLLVQVRNPTVVGLGLVLKLCNYVAC